jgi:hypothetical protein
MPNLETYGNRYNNALLIDQFEREKKGGGSKRLDFLEIFYTTSRDNVRPQ